jgi:hypothetical protein
MDPYNKRNAIFWLEKLKMEDRLNGLGGDGVGEYFRGTVCVDAN